MNKPTILLVEDDKASIDITKLFLAGVCDVDVAQNGFSAIEMAQNKKYPVILMDIGLSENMNGMQTTKEIRELPGYANTPVIALTAYAMKGDKEKFLANGLSDYLSKPFDRKTLVEIVKKLLFS